MTRRLHIGGIGKSAPDWEILKAMSDDCVDHVGNARDLSRFSDHTFAKIYPSYVLEHFDYKKEVNEALREWCRVLQPGGALYVSIPDL